VASLNDSEVVDEIIDAGESAASVDRPGMARVLAMVAARQVEAVLITKLDRITRSVRDLSDLLDTFARHHVALVSASESLNTESAAGRMVVRQLAVVSEWEREAIGERTSDALKAKRRRGERCGTIPLGWQLAADGRTLEPRDREQAMLRLAIECRDQQGLSWERTAAVLNEQGHRNRRGQPWVWETVRSALRTWSRHRGARGASAGA
jgi:site-specific DNA recombinase